MDYMDFKEQVKAQICDFLPEKFAEATVSITEVTKNNDTVLDGLVIRNDNVNISPTIYLNQYYDDLANGRDMDDILSRIADIYLDSYVDNNIDMSQLLNAENIMDKITCKLVNEEANQHYLQDKPYTKIDDLAAVYQIVLSKFDGGTASITINDKLAEIYGMDSDDLHRIAMDNMEALNPHVITSMNEIIVEMFAKDIAENDGIDISEARNMARAMIPSDELEDNTMMVITNESRVDGAAVILNDDVRQEIAEVMGGDYFVLPSSIHEVIVIPKLDGVDYRELEGMVQSINSGEVKPEERLSDHVYEYDSKNHELFRSDKGKSHEKDKKQEKEKERPSLKERLAEKKREAGSLEHKTDNRTNDKKREACM
jgi:hypothetical protein